MEISELLPDPYVQFAAWFSEAEASGKMSYPEAMSLSTIGLDGYPDSRMVLMKSHGANSFGSEGIVFYTNLNSTKAQSLAENPRVALNFYWMPLDRQVRIRGEVELVPDEVADAYFASRAKRSQLGAWASEQSEALESREVLLERLEMFKKKFAGGDIPRPPHWSGYLVKPVSFIFWEQVDNRLHDSFLYERNRAAWSISRRNP